jgi:SAM-dependent methyltransferase
MNQGIKQLLQRIGIYYPLQGFYRQWVNGYTASSTKRKYAVYKGDGYTCNFCHASYTKFAPWYPAARNKGALMQYDVIAGYGENIFCPNCRSIPRERLIMAIFSTSIDLRHKRILHLSPEKHLFDAIQQRAVVTTGDYHPAFYKKIDSSVQFADATGLSFANNSFDMVIANHIMEHIPNDRLAMKEIYRVLQPGGIAVMQVPFSCSIPHTIEMPSIDDPARQSALFGQHDHVRIYSLDDYLQHLQEAGFTVHYQPYSALADFYQYAIQKDEGFINITK